jgi:hypothetical protein
MTSGSADMLVPLTQFAPDADPGVAGALVDATGVMPIERSIKSAPEALDTGIATAASEIYGAATVERVDSSKTLYMGTATKLYSASGSTWTDVTRSAGNYSAPASSSWYFTTFGNQVLAANNGTVMQVSTGSLFADITGAPRAEIVETVGLFVMAFNASDGSSWDYDDGWWSSAQANATDWTPAIASGSVRGRLYATPGPIRAAKPLGEQMVVYKNSGVYLGTNSGPPLWWTWQLVPGDGGCVGKYAVAQIVVNGAPAHFVVGPRGMYVFDGSRPVKIGDGIVRRWFYQRLNPTYREKTSCVVDRAEGVVYILFANSESTGSLNDCLIYSFITGKWGRGRNYAARFGLQYLAPSSTFDTVPPVGVTYEAIDAPSYDDLFRDADMEAAAIVTTGDRIATLNGSANSSTFRTTYFGTDGNLSLMRRVRPRFIANPTAASMNLLVGDALGDVPSTYQSATYSNKRFDVLAEARWHQVDMTVTGGFEITALDVDLSGVSSE